jgi:hypothetical protein
MSGQQAIYVRNVVMVGRTLLRNSERGLKKGETLEKRRKRARCTF